MSSSKKRESHFTDALAHNSDKLQSIFEERRQIVLALKQQLSQQPQIQQTYLQQINQHCFEYSKIKPLINEINNRMRENRNKDPITDNTRFWQLNQSMEKDLEERLRNLKNIDITIDNIINEEFDKCNQMEEIEENIRLILGRKQQNHIQRAQPLFVEKQRCLQFLKSKKSEKQRVKDVKSKTLRQILDLLSQLKSHREARLRYCTQKTVDINQGKLLQALIHDFQQISRAKQTQENIFNNQKKFAAIIQDTNNRIERLIDEVFDNMNQQIKAFNSLQNAMRDRMKISYFEREVLKQTVPQLLKNQNNSKIMLQLSVKLQSFLRQQFEKGKQSHRITQGIATTTDTIKIFEHILQKIQSQNQRRKALMSHIQKLQQQHNFQSSKQQQIAELQSQAEKLQINKHRLQKTLTAKIDEADVYAYKSTHSELEGLQRQLKKMNSTLQKMKEQARQYAKLLYQKTNQIQQDFKDILSEIVPSIWFRDKDFTKEDTIKDMNIYLIKTFKRLSVAD